MIENLRNYMVPTVIERSGNFEKVYDIYSRLLKDRIIFVTGEIEDNMANAIVAQLLFLTATDSDSDITMYINSPGGSVSSAFAIYDTMQYIKSDVSTVCLGIAASAAAFLLSSGTKGKRRILPHAEVMIHQPLGGVSGQASDIDIHAKHILKTRDILNKLLAKNTGQKVSKIAKDTDRDNYLNAKEALEYGLVDEIIKS